MVFLDNHNNNNTKSEDKIANDYDENEEEEAKHIFFRIFNSKIEIEVLDENIDLSPVIH